MSQATMEKPKVPQSLQAWREEFDFLLQNGWRTVGNDMWIDPTLKKRLSPEQLKALPKWPDFHEKDSKETIAEKEEIRRVIKAAHGYVYVKREIQIERRDGTRDTKTIEQLNYTQFADEVPINRQAALAIQLQRELEAKK